jgi:hypothetical protein
MAGNGAQTGGPGRDATCTRRPRATPRSAARPSRARRARAWSELRSIGTTNLRSGSTVRAGASNRSARGACLRGATTRTPFCGSQSGAERDQQAQRSHPATDSRAQARHRRHLHSTPPEPPSLRLVVFRSTGIVPRHAGQCRATPPGQGPDSGERTVAWRPLPDNIGHSQCSGSYRR